MGQAFKDKDKDKDTSDVNKTKFLRPRLIRPSNKTKTKTAAYKTKT